MESGDNLINMLKSRTYIYKPESQSVLSEKDKKMRVELATASAVQSMIGMPRENAGSLHIGSIQALKQLSNNKQALDSVAQFSGLTSVQIVIPGYGLFTQHEHMANIVQLLRIIREATTERQICRIRSVVLVMPGWEGINPDHINSIVDFILGCTFLEQLRLNLAFWMDIDPLKKQINQQRRMVYGENNFDEDNFGNIMKIFKNCTNLKSLEFRCSNWKKINSNFMRMFLDGLGHQRNNDHLREFKLDLSGWGKNNKDINRNLLDEMKNILTDYNRLEEIHLDLRDWDQEYKLKDLKNTLKIIPCNFQPENSQISKFFKNTKSKGGVFGGLRSGFKSGIKSSLNTPTFKFTFLI